MDELESKALRLANELSDFGAELRLAYAYKQVDPGSSLTKSRIVMEKLLLDVYAREMGREPKKPLLGDMLADNQFTRKIERRILSRMNAIRDMGNLGPHGETVDGADATRVLDDLCTILDWYLQRTTSSQGARRPEPQPTVPPSAPPERLRREREKAARPDELIRKEEADWHSLQFGKRGTEDFKRFLKVWPNGAYSKLARMELATRSEASPLRALLVAGCLVLALFAFIMGCLAFFNH